MNEITSARYRASKYEEFSEDILRNATEASYISDFSPGGSPKDPWGNEMPSPQFYKIELNDIDKEAGDDLWEKWDAGERVFFQLQIADKYIVETRKPVAFAMPSGSSSLLANILEDEVTRGDTV